MYKSFALALAVLAGNSVAAPMEARNGDSYTYYKGDGSTAAGWPAQGSWDSFDQLWSANLPLIQKSCGWNGWGADNSNQEISDLKSAIQSVASAQGVDNRFVLAIVMQESKGCVRVPTTGNGVRNPGLMQDHNGSGTCNDNGRVQNPCPSSEIHQMIQDGVGGTSSGDGLKQTYAQAKNHPTSGAQTFYAAARIYNSGSATYSNLDDGRGSTNCYASDVANRLTGWTLAASKCTA